jgi:bacterioferritin-associated ferredoxin
MIVCHCKGITDRDIRKALLEGTLTRNDGEDRVRLAGSECGGCRPLIEQIIGKEAGHQPNDPKRSRR